MAPKHEKEAGATRERSLEVEKPDEPEEQTEESPLKLVKRRFVRRAKALQPMILDFLNVQTGIAASVIMDLVESRFWIDRREGGRRYGKNQNCTGSHFQHLQVTGLFERYLLLLGVPQLFLPGPCMVLRDGTKHQQRLQYRPVQNTILYHIFVDL